MTTRRHLNAAVIAAVGYLGVAAISIVKPQPDEHWNAAGRALEAAFIVGLLGSAIAITGVADRFTRGALGRWSARLAQFGFVGISVASVASLIKGGDTLGPVFVLSLLTTLVGLLLLGISGVRDGVTPRWAPVVPFATMLIGIALAEHGGCAVIAAGWLAMVAVANGRAGQARPATAAA